MKLKQKIKNNCVWFIIWVMFTTWLTYAWNAWYIWDLFEIKSISWVNKMFIKQSAIPTDFITDSMVKSVAANKITSWTLGTNVQAVTKSPNTSDSTIATTEFVNSEIRRICWL